MGLLKILFGPSKEAVWQELARKIGGRFDHGSGFGGHAHVQQTLDDWIVTLDTFTVSTGKSSVTYTRLRAPFLNPTQFRFTIYRTGFFGKLGKLLGMQDIEVGNVALDRDFIVQSNSVERVRALFEARRIARLIRLQPQVYLTVEDNEGWFAGKFPPGVDELYFRVGGVLTDLGQLQRLFELFSEVLLQLARLDAAGKEEEDRHVDALLAPGGQIRDGQVLLWDGDPARRNAAEALGRLRSRKGVPSLLSVLDAPDTGLRIEAARSLGAIGDPEAVPRLIPLLGDPATGAEARAALGKLGREADLAAFDRVLAGELSSAAPLRDAAREPFVAAFARLLDAPDPRRAGRAAGALAELSAVELLPKVRAARRTHRAHVEARDLLDAAVRELERRSDLPRASEAPAPSTEQLPTPAGAPESDPEDLPRVE